MPTSKKSQVKAPTLDSVVDDVLKFVDKRGKVLFKDSSPVHSELSMKYSQDGIEAKIDVQVNVHGNGHCAVVVKQDRKVVFNATGNYTTGCFNATAKTNKDGTWRKKLKLP